MVKFCSVFVALLLPAAYCLVEDCSKSGKCDLLKNGAKRICQSGGSCYADEVTYPGCDPCPHMGKSMPDFKAEDSEIFLPQLEGLDFNISCQDVRNVVRARKIDAHNCMLIQFHYDNTCKCKMPALPAGCDELSPPCQLDSADKMLNFGSDNNHISLARQLIGRATFREAEDFLKEFNVDMRCSTQYNSIIEYLNKPTTILTQKKCESAKEFADRICGGCEINGQSSEAGEHLEAGRYLNDNAAVPLSASMAAGAVIVGLTQWL